MKPIYQRLRSFFATDYALLYLIVLVGASLRLYAIPTRYSLGIESIRDAIVAYEASNLGEIPLTGPFSSLGPFTFGPWYWWHLALFQHFYPLAYAPWLLLSINSILYIVLLFFIGKKLGGKLLGYCMALLAALSPVQITSSLLLTNPPFIHAYVAITLVLFVVVLSQSTKPLSKQLVLYAFLLGLVLGIGANIHYQMIGFFVIPGILLLFFRRMIGIPLLTLLGMAMTFLPLFIFDVGHRFYLSQNIIKTYTTLHERVYVPNSWKIYLFDFWPHFIADTFGFPYILSLGFLIIGLLSVVFFFWQQRKIPSGMGILLLFVLNFVYLRYYSGERSFSYVFYMQPFLFMMAGILCTVIWQRFGKIPVLILLSLYVYTLLPTYRLQLMPNQNYTQTAEIVAFLQKEVGTRPVSLYTCKGDANGEVYNTGFLLSHNKQWADDSLGSPVLILSDMCPSNIIGSSGNVATIGATTVVVLPNEVQDSAYSLVTRRGLYNSFVHWEPNYETLK